MENALCCGMLGRRNNRYYVLILQTKEEGTTAKSDTILR